MGKDPYLDCAGPVAHGYNGYCVSGRGFSAGTRQVTFCQGAATVMSDAIRKVRPA